MQILKKPLKYLFIFAVLLLIPFFTQANANYYQAVLRMEDNKFILMDVAMVKEPVLSDEKNIDYSYVLVDKKDNILAQDYLLKDDLELSLISGKNIFIFSVPFDQAGERIKILDAQAKEMLSIEVDYLSTCGNGICDPDENYSTCPIDCPASGLDGYCDLVRDGICDLDCLILDSEIKDADCFDEKNMINKAEVEEYLASIEETDSEKDKDKPTETKIEKKFDRKIFLAALLIIIGFFIIAAAVYYYKRKEK